MPPHTVRAFQVATKAEDRAKTKEGCSNMKKEEILNNIAIELWQSKAIDCHNYNHDFQAFRRDFLKICTAELDGIISSRAK